MLPDFRVRQRDYLLEISRALTEELDLERVLARIVRVSAELLAGRACLIALRDPSGWQVAASYGIDPSFLRRVDRMLADIPEHAEPERFEFPEVSSRLQRVTRAASMGLLSGVGLPLIAREELIGVIFVFRGYEGSFSAQDRAVLQAFASQAAIAVHNARLYSEVIAQKQHLDSVVDSAADGIFILDNRFRFQRFNRACSRMTGHDEADVLGLEHREIIRWLDREEGPTLEEAARSGWPQSERATLYVEGGLLRKSGEALPVGITYAPTLAAENRLLSIVANIRDITKFREAEELKSTFISIISHELRTPVALIKGYVETLRREDAQWDPTVIDDSLGVIEEETDRLAAMIEDLLDASRLQAGALGLNRAELSLAPLLERMLARFRTQSDKHEFSLEITADLPSVNADEARLRQVLSNLLSNAVKYAPAGGKIRLQCRQESDSVILCVQDEGPGIAAEDVTRIFDRFYRGQEMSKRSKGTGLGLYLAKAIVEAHGGDIWVDERVKDGARICFSLPVWQDEARRKT